MSSHRTQSVFYLAAVGAFLAISGVGWWVYQSKSHELTGLNTELATKTDELQTLQDKVAQLPKMTEDFGQLKSRLAILEPALPTAEYVPTFLQQIEKMAIETGNVIDGIRPRPARAVTMKPKAAASSEGADAKGLDTPNGATPVSETEQQSLDKARKYYDVLALQISVLGDFHTIQKFLDRLTQFPKMIAINEIAARPPVAVEYGEKPQLLVTLDAVALVLKPIPDLDTTSDPAPRPAGAAAKVAPGGAQTRRPASRKTDAQGGS